MARAREAEGGILGSRRQGRRPIPKAGLASSQRISTAKGLASEKGQPSTQVILIF